MKKILVFALAALFLLPGAGLVFAQPEHKTMEQLPPWQREMEWFCPYCGSQRGAGNLQMQMGEKEKGAPLTHLGTCPSAAHAEAKPVDEAQAKQIAAHYISTNPNLKVGPVTEQDGNYVADIVTKDNSLVEKVVVDKKTGWIKVTY